MLGYDQVSVSVDLCVSIIRVKLEGSDEVTISEG